MSINSPRGPDPEDPIGLKKLIADVQKAGAKEMMGDVVMAAVSQEVAQLAKAGTDPAAKVRLRKMGEENAFGGKI